MKLTSLLTGLFFVLVFSACKTKAIEQKETPRIPATNPLVMDTSFTKEYVAEIESIQNIEIRAKVKGYLESIKVDEGQQVAAGQLLFTIRSKEFEAELAQAQAKVKTAELEMQNVKTLQEKDIVSKAELALAVAKLNEARSELGIAETNLSFTKVVAPFSGIVDRLKFKVGSLVDEGTLLTSLSNNRSIYTYFNVTEAEYLDYKARQEHNEVSLIMANGEPFKYKGKIETIEAEFDKSTGNIPFRAEFPNPDLLLKHGETGKVQLTIDLKNALVIPQKATFELQDKTYVYVVDEKNMVKARNISIKHRLPNLYVVDSGLQSSDKILLEGIQTIKEDDKVETEFLQPAKVIADLQLIKQ